MSLLACGDGMAVAGAFRAGALFAAPSVVAGLLGLIALGPTVGVTGTALLLAIFLRPSWRVGLSAKRSCDPTGSAGRLPQ